MIASNPSFRSIENLIGLAETTSQINTADQARELGRAVWRVIDALAATDSLPRIAAGQYNTYSGISLAPVAVAPAVEASFGFRISSYPIDLSTFKDWTLSSYNDLTLLRYDTPEDLMDLNQEPASETTIILKPWHYMPQREANRDKPYTAQLEARDGDRKLFGPYVEPVIAVLGQLAEHYATVPARS